MRAILPTAIVMASFLSGLSAQRRDFYDIDKIQRVSFTFKQSNWKALLQQNYPSRTYIRCDVDINGTLYKDAGVRYRGASSFSKIPANSEKQPYKVKLDQFVPGQRYQGYGTMNFGNNFMDPTWVREPIGYYLARQFMAAPKSNYVALKINNVDFGPFVNTQQMNKSFMREWFPSDDGNRYKPSVVGSKATPNDRSLAYLGALLAPYQAAFEIKNENAVAPHADLVAVTNALNNSGANIETALPRLMDVDNALRMNAADVTLLRLDSYVGPICQNFLLYHEEKHGRFQFMPQDTNNIFVFGGKDSASLARTPLDFGISGKGGGRPLQARLHAVPAWKSRYIAHARNISQWLDWAKLKPVIDRFQKAVAPAAAADPKRLYAHSMFTSNLTNDVVITQFKLTVFGIKPVVDARKAFLANLAEFKSPNNTISVLALSPTKPTSASALQFTVKVIAPSAQSVDKVKLHWRIVGPYTSVVMFDDGQHGDAKANDGIYGVRLPAQTSGNSVEYYVESTVKNGGVGNMNFLPSTATFQPRNVYIDHPRGGPALRINELMARNNTTIKDSANEFEDWVEIYNSTNANVKVSGMYLSDNPTLPTKWKIPTNQSIPAKGTLLIWCDNDANDGPLHATFKLDGDGEWVGLFDTDGITLIDDQRFGPQEFDVSIGRLPDGQSLQVSFQDPSPRVANAMKDRTPACGNQRFSHLNPFNHVVKLAANQLPKLATTVILNIDKAPASSVAVVLFGSSQIHVPFTHSQALLAGFPLVALLILPTDAQGKAALPLPLPNNNALLGSEITFQSIGVTAQLEYRASNAVIMRFCPK